MGKAELVAGMGNYKSMCSFIGAILRKNYRMNQNFPNFLLLDISCVQITQENSNECPPFFFFSEKREIYCTFKTETANFTVRKQETLHTYIHTHIHMHFYF
jgi:hypothetical protein